MKILLDEYMTRKNLTVRQVSVHLLNKCPGIRTNFKIRQFLTSQIRIISKRNNSTIYNRTNVLETLMYM